MTSSYLPQFNLNQPRILCVDDDEVTLRLRGQVLEAEGYRVLLVPAPLEALRCDLSTVQLAVIDFEMPGLDGLQLLLKLRAAHASFPIILVSGRIHQLDSDVCRLFHACINKADPVQNLLDVIRSYLSGAPDPQCARVCLNRLRLNPR